MNVSRCCATLAALALGLSSTAFGQANPKFDQVVIGGKTPGNAVAVDVDISGAKQLFLVALEGNDGIGMDWADWVEPQLSGPAGTKKLTELKWRKADAGWGKVHKDLNVNGGRLVVAGKPVDFGIGTHANSVVEFDLPAGYTRFQARAAIDDGGVRQGGNHEVRFQVYTEKPPAATLAAPQQGDSGVGGHLPENAVAGLEVAAGLEATLFAAEPLLLSPSDIDVDHLGRVWVCEVVNYRHRQGSRPEGDRILILEDTDHDGKADKQTVFYQGKDIDSALGICVLGNRVIVSVAPNVFIFTDEDGDGKADKKELLFSKVGQPQHDHSTHAFVFGPDGKLYFNVGNSGGAVHDKDGNPITDLAGNVVASNGKPYRQGMAFRCNVDGSDFEVLASNFRNNYEVAVDSFGTLWQSDNDDDGNRGVRINYVMEFGNYGYSDEMTGSGWQTPRTNIESEIPRRHWHLNDPGVVPNLLQTGSGSPTGICVYEGSLLPEVFRNQVIHCDAGPNVCRAYPATADGAGYKAEIANILEGTRDKWFRPSDVCVAPDGSLIVADWYDPGVGGHHMGDIDKGRIFRVAPPNTSYVAPKYDLASAAGAAKALESPNLSARYLAWTALHAMGTQAEPVLAEMFAKNANPRFRARALWLLSKLPEHAQKYIEQGLADKDSDIRITALRAARELQGNVLPYVKQLSRDPSPQVRRECAIALRHNSSTEAALLWADLAVQHDGHDRWYLEAMGIGADRNWDAYLAAWLGKVGSQWNAPAGRDIIWRSRATATPDYLAKLIADPATPADELPRYFRAFDFLTGDKKDEAVTQLAFGGSASDPARQRLIMAEAVTRLNGSDLKQNAAHMAAVNRLLDASRGTPEFVQLVERLKLTERYPEVLALAAANADSQLGIDAIRSILATAPPQLLKSALADADSQKTIGVIRVLGNSQDKRVLGVLEPLVVDESRPADVRQEAVRALGKSQVGLKALIKLAEKKKLDPYVTPAATFALHSSNDSDIKNRANELFPLPPSKDNKPMPALRDLLGAKGSADRGKQVFAGVGTCAKCHVVNGEGKEVGPNLSEIGSKLAREALFESVLYPSAGISHNYENFAVQLADGNVVVGILTSETPQEVSIKGADALVRTFKRADIEQLVKQKTSLMPADLQKAMSSQELIDVVEYLSTLKKK